MSRTRLLKEVLFDHDDVGRLIFLIRGKRVILDADLAQLYGVTTKRINEQIKRNRERFPEDFLFQLTQDEKRQVVANCDHLLKLKYSPVLPYAFTEHGTIMAATVLNSRRAVHVSLLVVRTFVKLRETLGAHKELASKFAELERRFEKHDEHIATLFEAIRRLMAPPPEPSKRKIGFIVDRENL